MYVSVAKAVAEALKLLGVERIYGLVGTSIIDFFDALYDYREEIRLITTRHEQVAASMADAEGRITGRPGVALVHAGPGFLNALIGVSNAYKDSSPMILIAGAVRRRLKGLDSWLEVDQVSIAKHITKAQFTISEPSDALDKIVEAYNVAISPPQGPVLVEVHEDVWSLRSEYDFSKVKVEPREPPKPTIDDIETVFKYIERSQKPVILAGGGVSDPETSEYIRKLAELLEIPVATTGAGRGVLPEDHPLSLGRVGFGGGSTYADKAFEESDLLIALGCSLSDITTYNYSLMPKGDIILVNLDKKTEERPIPYSEWFYVDARSFTKMLYNYVKERGFKKSHPDWLNEIDEYKKGWYAILEEALNREYDVGVNPNKFFKELNNFLEMENAIITAGQGMHILYTYAYLKIKKPRTFLAATNMGAMGFAFPAALAAKLVKPNKEVLAIVGDGEFMMTIQDLETATREKIPVKTIVVNDNSYRVLYYRQKIQKMGRIHGTILGNPDFEKLAKSFGADGLVVERDNEISDAIKKMLESEKPFVLDLRINRDDLPPLNLEASLKMTAI